MPDFRVSASNPSIWGVTTASNLPLSRGLWGDVNLTWGLGSIANGFLGKAYGSLAKADGLLGLHFEAETNGRHFPDDIFKYIFLNENVLISIKISLKFVPKGQINNIPALV